MCITNGTEHWKIPLSCMLWHTGTQSYYSAEGNSHLQGERRWYEVIPQTGEKYVSVSKCVCSGLQKLINYTQASGSVVLLFCFFVFHPLFVSFLVSACLPGRRFANSYGWTSGDIQGPSVSEDQGFNWIIVTHLFPIINCYLRASLEGRLYSKPVHCIFY